VVGQDFTRRIADFFHDYDQGIMDIFAYEACLLQPLKLYPLEKMIALRSAYLKRIHRAIRPEMTVRVNWHRAQKHTLLLITASNSFLAEPIARMLNIPNLICTNVETNGSGYTGFITGIPAYQEGKIQRLEVWLKQNQLSLRGSWGYSDSFNDLPLLQRVDHPVAVTPDHRLAIIAKNYNWPIILT
jgi:HAD superfamily hydrolase (TIGR01490 family)